MRRGFWRWRWRTRGWWWMWIRRRSTKRFLMRQRVHRNIDRNLLRILGHHPLAQVAGVSHGQGAAQTVLPHHGHQIPLVEEPFEIDVAVSVRRADAVHLVEGPVYEVIVRNSADGLAGEDAAELATPGSGELGIRAAAGGEGEAAVR